jgi:hypothetical protein
MTGTLKKMKIKMFNIWSWHSFKNSAVELAVI